MTALKQSPARRWALSIAALICSFATSAAVAGIEVNGGFETGTLAGWTLGGDTSFVGVSSGIEHSGVYAAFFGPPSTATLSQTLVTQAGTPYQVTFWLALDDSATPNSFSWSWAGLAQNSLSNSSAFGYTSFSRQLVATGASTVLQFAFSNPESFWRLDDVTVTAIPEPETAALMLVGLAAIGAMRRRSLKGSPQLTVA